MNYAGWNDTVKEGLKNFALASMDALIYPFFWTWKVSRMLGRPDEGALGFIISLSCFFLGYRYFYFYVRAEAVGTSTGLNHILPMSHHWPEINSYLHFSPFRCHLDLSFPSTGSLVPHGPVGQPGPRWSDSVPCITPQTPGFFLFHNRLECPLPIDTRPPNVGVLSSIFS
jgi:hypothetical protein